MFNFLSHLKALFRSMNSSSSNDLPMTSTSDMQSHSKFIPKMGSIIPLKAFMTESIVDKLENSHVNAWQELSQHFVSKLEYYKRQAGKNNKPEHEYLVAYIVDDKQKTSRLMIERRASESGQAVGKNRPEKTTHRLLDSLRALYNEGLSSSDTTTPLRRTPTTAVASSSFSVASRNSTVGSIPNSSQDSSSNPVEADDVIIALRSDKVVTDPILRVFEPEGRNLSFLHFCIIVEDVHDQEPDYKLFRSQCYWFAMMVMGISMLQGGYVQIYANPTKNGTAKPYCATLRAHSTTNRQMPSGLDHELPIPSLSEEGIQATVTDEEIKHITNVGSAGTIQSITYGLFKVRVIRVSFNAIWEAGRESHDHYDVLLKELARVQNFVVARMQYLEDEAQQAKEEKKRADERAQRSDERAQRAEERAQRAEAELERQKKSGSR